MYNMNIQKMYYQIQNHDLGRTGMALGGDVYFHRIVVEERDRPLGKLTNMCDDNINIDVKVTGRKGGDCIQLAL